MGKVSVGELVATGRTSDVHALGRDAVVKVPHAHVPDEWARYEADLSSVVRAAGVPAPAALDVVQVGGRDAVVFEWVRGPSMWEQILAAPAEIPRLTDELAAIQRSLLSVGPVAGVPDFVDRLGRRIQAATELTTEDRVEAAEIAAGLARGAALLHGDLHPGNVLMSPNGPVVIDWFDAAIGHPIADLVRTSILVRPRTVAPAHLPGATEPILAAIHERYLGAFEIELGAVKPDLARWQALVAAARMAEGAEVNHTRLLDLWARRGSSPERSLAEQLA